MKIPLNNYEAYLLRYVDGELDPEEVSGLLRWLEEHPAQREELKWLRATKLNAEDAVVFGDKASLYRTQEPPLKKRIPPPRPLWIKVLVAASVAGLAMVYFQPWKTAPKAVEAVVRTSHPGPLPSSRQPLAEKDSANKTLPQVSKSGLAPLQAVSIQKRKKRKGVSGPAMAAVRDTTARGLSVSPPAPAIRQMPPVPTGEHPVPVESPVLAAGTPKTSASPAQSPVTGPYEEKTGTLVPLEDKIADVALSLNQTKKNMDQTVTVKLADLHEKTSGLIDHLEKKGIRIGRITFAIND